MSWLTAVDPLLIQVAKVSGFTFKETFRAPDLLHLPEQHWRPTYASQEIQGGFDVHPVIALGIIS